MITELTDFGKALIERGDAPIKSQYLISREINVESETRSEVKRDKSNRGQNKNRKENTYHINDAKRLQLCPSIAVTNTKCNDENCKYLHEISSKEDEEFKDTTCPLFELYGLCRYGMNCRYFKSHTNEGNVDVHGNQVSEITLKTLAVKENSTIKNSCSQKLRDALKKRTYDFKKVTLGGGCETADKYDDENSLENKQRKLFNSNNLILAPLTTVGNMPFRRICVNQGADLTMSEMALASSIIEGKQSDLVLLKRHISEKLFGIQIATGHTDTLDKCPLEPLHKKMAGAILLNRPKLLESLAQTMRSAAPNHVISMKLRAGFTDKFNVHTILPSLENAGINAFIIHGRTSRQRYTKSADWDYLKQCYDVCTKASLIGCGDVYTWEDYYNKKSVYSDNIMIGRAALIKPWIFTEIKEKRTWDISASERLDILKDFVNYGLELWGTDKTGIETTRRFLLEFCSFFHRYVPVGIMESVIPKINWRAPPFVGRNDLETLLGSPKVDSWIEISEMLLGKVPHNFKFTPKHKAVASVN